MGRSLSPSPECTVLYRASDVRKTLLVVQILPFEYANHVSVRYLVYLASGFMVLRGAFLLAGSLLKRNEHLPV